MLFVCLRDVTWNAPKSMWRRYLARDSICICFVSKSNIFMFGDFPDLKLVTCFFLEISYFFMFENLEMPNFFHFQNQMRKWGVSRFSNKKVEHYEKKSTWSIQGYPHYMLFGGKSIRLKILRLQKNYISRMTVSPVCV